MAEQSALQALNAALRARLADDERSLVLGETVWSGGASGVTAGLYEEFGEARVRETPVSENAIVQASLGLALEGFRPIVEIYSADFLLAVANEVINDIAKWRAQHGRPRHLPITIRGPMGAAGGLGPEHSQCIERYFYQAPGLQVVVPGKPEDCGPLLAAVLAGEEPTLFLEHRRLYPMNFTGTSPGTFTGTSPGKCTGPGKRPVVRLGQADLVRQGTAVTIVAWGWMVQEAIVAAQSLAAAGIEADLIDLRTIVPMDIDAVLGSVSVTGRLVTVEEAPRRGGVGAEIVAAVVEWLGPGIQVRRVGMGDHIHPYRPDLEAALLPDAREIEHAVTALCDLPLQRRR